MGLVGVVLVMQADLDKPGMGAKSDIGSVCLGGSARSKGRQLGVVSIRAGWAAESGANVPPILSASSICAFCASAAGFICSDGGCCGWRAYGQCNGNSSWKLFRTGA